MEFARVWGLDEPRPPLEALARLRADLEGASFTVETIESLWSGGGSEGTAGQSGGVQGGADAAAALARGHRVPALRRLDGDARPVALLARLFVLGDALSDAELETALPSLGAEGAAALGLTASDPGAAGTVRAAIDLRPYAFADAHGAGEWWIASDPGELQTGGALREDHVLGVGGASTTLAGLLLQRPARTVLDLGTGSGIQALHARRFAEHVVATDLSARALAFARFTTLLNGVDGIELRQGSLYEPVAGQRFDRIVSNPPFVITPRTAEVPAYDYRDGGMVGDGIVEAVVRGAARHLEPGGIAQLLGNWESTGGRDGLDRLRDRLDGSGLDYWVVERERQDPSEYAETWIRDGGTRPGTPGFEAMHAAWLDDFAARGVDAVGFGYVLLRRPAESAAPSLARTERLHGPVAPGLGEHLDRALAAWDAVAGLDDAGLAALRLATAPDVTEERHHWPGDEAPTAILIRQGGGFGRTVPAGTALAALLGAADGELPLGAISAAIAELTDAPADALWAELAAEVRELVLAGILLPGPADVG